LLGVDPPDSAEPHSVLLVREAFAAADPAVNAALEPALARLRRRLGERLRNVSLRDVDGEAPDSGLAPYMTAYCHLQWAEIWSSLGAWIEDAKPEFGPAVAVSFDLVRRFDRRQIAHAVRLRERLARALGSFLGPGDLLCLPTAHTTAPKRGAPIVRAFDRPTFYSRALGLTALAGIGRLCQVTIPVAEADQLPVGLSLLAAHGNDASLLGALAALAPTLFPDQESP
jgi:amidase